MNSNIRSRRSGRSQFVRKFIWTHRRSNLVVASLSFGFFSLLIISLSFAHGNFWDEWMSWALWEPITGMTILTVAILLWLGEVNQDWENSLSKRVTAIFLYPTTPDSTLPNRIAMVCEEAFLAGEDELRTWSQQLGSQMANNQKLKFGPFIRDFPGQIIYPAGAQPFKHYITVFQLTEVPVPDGEEAAKKAFDNRKTIHFFRGPGDEVQKVYSKTYYFDSSDLQIKESASASVS